MDASSDNPVKAIRLLYITFFLGLASLAAWDVALICSAYLNDNRLTSVRRESMSYGNVRFLNRSSICMVYSHNNVPFPGMPPKDEDLYRMMLRSWRHEDIPWIRNMSAEEITLAENIFTIILYTRIRDIDISGLSYPMAYFSDISEFIPIADALISRPDVIPLVTDAWSIAQKRFIQTRQPSQNAYLQLADERVVCFFLSLASDLKPQKSDYVERYGEVVGQHMEYSLDMVYSTRDLAGAQSVPTAERIDVHLSGDTLSIQGDFKNKTVKAKILITNGLIFDSSQFPPCSSKFEIEEACILDLRSRTIEDACGCIQLSRAVLEAMRENASRALDRPLCTAAMYETCWDIGKIEADKKVAQAKEDGACKPCKFGKAQYELVFTDMEPVDMHPYYPRFLLSFELRDRTYLSFEDKTQFSLSQLISQIGGDLGLYIGFSMLSILRAISLIFYGYRRHREYGRGWAQYLGQVLFHACEMELRNDLEKHKRDTMERIAALEKIVEEQKQVLEEY